MISSYKVIFLDAGGTLFHPFPSVGEIYERVGRKYGCSASAEELEVLFHETWHQRDGLIDVNEKIEREWWRSLVREVFSRYPGMREFEDFFSELYDTFASPECWRLYEDVPEVLQRMLRAGKRLAIISNWDSRLFRLCEGLGIQKYFDTVLASAVVGASKPSPKIFEEALRRMNAKPREAVHVGDSLSDDVHGAIRAGIDAVLIDRKGRVGESPSSFRVIQELAHLLA